MSLKNRKQEETMGDKNPKNKKKSQPKKKK